MKTFLSTLTLFAALLVLGCGPSEPPKPAPQPAPRKLETSKAPTKAPVVKEVPSNKIEAVTEKKVTPSSDVPAPQAKPAEAPKDLVDFASLKGFPDLRFETGSTIPSNGDPRIALMDGKRFKREDGTNVEGYWCSVPPATFEVTLPFDQGATSLSRIEVEDFGGEFAFGDCQVELKTTPEGAWGPLPNGKVAKEQVQAALRMNTRWVFSMPKTPAVAVRLKFPKGCAKFASRVFVSDIDILGSIEK